MIFEELVAPPEDLDIGPEISFEVEDEPSHPEHATPSMEEPTDEGPDLAPPDDDLPVLDLGPAVEETPVKEEDEVPSFDLGLPTDDLFELPGAEDEDTQQLDEEEDVTALSPEGIAGVDLGEVEAVAGAPSPAAGEPSGRSKVIYAQDFDSEPVDSMPANWQGDYPYASLKVTDVDPAGGGGNCIVFEKESGEGRA